jgi:hypothetical protein
MASTFTGTVSAVSVLRHLVDDRNDQERARFAQRFEAAQAQDHGALPLVGDLHRRGDEHRHNRGDEQRLALRPQLQEDHQRIGGPQ